MAAAAQTMTGAPALTRAPQRTEHGVREERPAALPALTGLRFVAAAAVVVNHLLNRHPLAVALPAPLAALTDSGAAAVSLFFVLSGFVLTHTYLGPDGRLRGSLRAFYAARVARVYPVYLLGVLCGGVVALAVGGVSAGGQARTGLATLALLHAWVPLPAVWDGPAWSLSAEALFYAAFPLLAPALAALSTQRLCALLVTLYGLSFSGPVLLWAGVLRGGYGYQVAMQGPYLRLPEFMLGIGAALLWRRGALRCLPASGPLAAALLAGLMLTGGLAQPWRHNGLLAPLACALIVALATGRGALCRLLASRAACALGAASYALYLLHYPLVQGLEALLPGHSAPALALAYLPLSLGLSLLVYACLEEPARRARRARLCAAPRRAAPPRSAPRVRAAGSVGQSAPARSTRGR